MTDTLWPFDLRRGNPSRVCPVIDAFGRGISNAMSDAGRERLRAFIPRLIGTVDPIAERDRAEHLAWQAIRVFAPMALDAIGHHDDAERLRSLEGSLAAAAANAAAYAYVAAGSAASAVYAVAAGSAPYAAAEDAMVTALDGVLKIGQASGPGEA